MFKTLRLMAVCALFHATNTAAGPITDTIFADGKEWAQVDLFSGATLAEFTNACGTGACSNTTLNGFDIFGWNWASLTDVVGLFNSHIGASLVATGPGIYSEDDADWAQTFFSSGWRTNNSSPTLSDLSGITSNPAALAGCNLVTIGGNCVAVIQYCSGPDCGGSAVNSKSTVLTVFNSNIGQALPPGPALGGWFYKNDVPTPGTMGLMVLAFLLLGSRIKKS